MGGFKLGSVGFAGTLAATIRAIVQGVDPTRFALFLKSYKGANTATTWKDLSGNGHDLIQNPTSSPFVLTANSVNGKQAYVGTAANTQAYWQLPAISTNATDMTIYMAVRVDEVSNSYVSLLPQASGGLLYLGINSGDIGTYNRGGVHGPIVTVSAGQVAVIVWRLNSAGASVRKNGYLFASGLPFTSATYALGGLLFNQSNSQQLRGAQLAYAVSLGNDTDAQVAQYEAEIAAECGITLVGPNSVPAGSYGLFSRTESNKVGGWYSYNNSNGIQPPAGTTGGGMINADPNSGAGLDIAATFEIHFQGTGFQLFGLSNSPYGEATATLDGVVQAAPISYHGGSGSVISVYAVSGLPFGNHVFRHQCTGYAGSSCIPQFYTIT